jgi:hypothetical protein
MFPSINHFFASLIRSPKKLFPIQKQKMIESNFHDKCRFTITLLLELLRLKTNSSITRLTQCTLWVKFVLCDYRSLISFILA